MKKDLYTLNTDNEFQQLIRPLTSEERKQLEANIVADGCRDPITVWNGIIIDGHNRYEICHNHNIHGIVLHHFLGIIHMGNQNCQQSE